MASEATAAAQSRPVEFDFGALFKDLWASELKSLSDPALTAQYAEARKAFDKAFQYVRTRAAANQEYHQTSLSLAVEDCVGSFWLVLMEHPDVYRSPPASVFSHESCETLCQLVKAAIELCPAEHTEHIRTGSELIDSSVSACARKEKVDADFAVVASLLEAWGDEFCNKRCGVTVSWAGSEKRPALNALTLAARAGNIPMAELILRSGASIDGLLAALGGPLQAAFDYGHVSLFSRLLQLGADESHLRFLSEAVMRRKHLATTKELFGALINARPSILLSDTHYGAYVLEPWERDAAYYSFLDAAIVLGLPELAVAALDAGATVRDHTTHMPTLIVATTHRCLPVLRRLITEGKALPGWREKYNPRQLKLLASSLLRAALRAYDAESPCAESAEIVSLFLDGPEPFTHCWYGGENNDTNGILDRLFNGGVTSYPGASMVAVLKRYHEAGTNIVSLRKKEVDSGQIGFNLLAMSARLNLPLVLEFAHSIGIPVDETWPVVNPQENFKGTASALNLVIKFKQPLPMVRSLLTKYKAKAAYPALGVMDQPIAELLCYLDRYTDDEALPVLKALLDSDSTLLDIPCFAARNTVIAKDDPLASCALSDKRKCLELLLRRLPVARRIAASTSFIYSFSPGPRRTSGRTGNLGQLCAHSKRWDCLALVLQHTGVTVTSSIIAGNPPVGDLVREAIADSQSPPPRPLVAMVEARARAELGESGPSSAPSMSAEPCNSFEDPSVKVLTEKEAKAKAKRKAAKKKARARRRAKQAASAGAGAAAACAESSDDTSSEEEPFEEPDDNLVDSRNAPSLDIMLAAMQIAPGGSSAGEHGTDASTGPGTSSR